MRIYIFLYFSVFRAEYDECVQHNHTCDINARCDNTHGSYICTCIPKFTGNGEQCLRELQILDQGNSLSRRKCSLVPHQIYASSCCQFWQTYTLFAVNFVGHSACLSCQFHDLPRVHTRLVLSYASTQIIYPRIDLYGVGCHVHV